jgi:hypothetical protein
MVLTLMQLRFAPAFRCGRSICGRRADTRRNSGEIKTFGVLIQALLWKNLWLGTPLPGFRFHSPDELIPGFDQVGGSAGGNIVLPSRLRTSSW